MTSTMSVRLPFVVRFVTLLLALAACAWFVVSIRQAEGTARAQAIVSANSTLTASQAQRADSLLRSARFLNPDRQVDILRAEVVAECGNLSEADSILFGVVRAEPMNVNAWFQLASHPRNPQIFAQAARTIFRLVRLLKTSH